MRNGPMAQHAVKSLTLLRSLDDSRLVLQQSGRWDGQYNIGSVCNPGGTQWEYTWGAESADYQGTAKAGPFGGYFQGAGDAHIYPAVPHTPEIEAGIRNLGSDSKPVFLSEYGIGSLMNAVREVRHYEQHGADPEWDDFKFLKQTEEKLAADWKRFGMEGVYAFPEEMLRAESATALPPTAPRVQSDPLESQDLRIQSDRAVGPRLLGRRPLDILARVQARRHGGAPGRLGVALVPVRRADARLRGAAAEIGGDSGQRRRSRAGNLPGAVAVVGPDGIAWEETRELVIPKPALGDDGPWPCRSSPAR